MSRRPVVFETDETAASTPPPSPADAPPVPDTDGLGGSEGEAPPAGAAMRRATVIAGRKPSRFGRIVWGALGALIGLAVSLAAWDFVMGLFARAPALGWLAAVLGGIVVLGAVALALREVAAMARLAQVDRLQADTRAARAAADRPAALGVVTGLDRLYADRDEMTWPRGQVERWKDEVLDADALLALAERQFLDPLDRAAVTEIEAASRGVAMATAVVPMALIDVAVALGANLRMVRRIAEIYGGRAGTVGSWRLMRAVAAHLVATGAVAVGDDMVGSLVGGGALARISRRFGEGVINGALTARVGVAAMEVCRPMPFHALERPRVAGLVKRALGGIFSSGEAKDAGSSA